MHKTIDGYDKFQQWLDDNSEDYFLFRARYEINQAGNDINRKTLALTTVCRLLLYVKDSFRRDYYLAEYKKLFKVSKKVLDQKLQQLSLEEDEAPVSKDISIPKEVDADQAYKQGFYEHKKAYHFITTTGIFEGSNFKIRPLFHIYSKSDNKRLIEIENCFGSKRIIDVPTQKFVSIDQFQGIVAGEGNFLFYGNKQMFFKVLSKVMQDFPMCYELRTLGWQREGFYAFSNGIFTDKYQPVDQMGIVEFNGEKYFSPAYSSVYKDVREDDDEYEGDRFFEYRTSTITFKSWAEKMVNVYSLENNGRIAVAFAIASVFRDFIYNSYKIFPHLFLFGEKQSGKSQLGWSLSSLFFTNMPPFNLNSGTNVGFFRRLARFRNTISWYDEYTNDTDEKRFQSLKAAYDGVGHEKGKLSRDNRTEVTKINASCVISGQYLPTRDDNALFTRSIILNFVKKEFTKQEIEAYDNLKKIEEQGISSIVCEILDFRKLIESRFVGVFAKIFDTLKNDLLKLGEHIEERLIRNFAVILAPVKIIEQQHTNFLPFSFNDLYLQATNKIVELSAMISSSEALAVFWDMVEYLLDSKIITNGYDFKIEILPAGTPLKVFKGYKDGQRIKEDYLPADQTDLLYLKLSKIHGAYLEAHRKQYGQNGMELNSLIHYMESSKYYIGKVLSTRFNDSNTSAIVFNYDILRRTGLNLERTTDDLPNDSNNENSRRNDDVPF